MFLYIFFLFCFSFFFFPPFVGIHKMHSVLLFLLLLHCYYYFYVSSSSFDFCQKRVQPSGGCLTSFAPAGSCCVAVDDDDDGHDDDDEGQSSFSPSTFTFLRCTNSWLISRWIEFNRRICLSCFFDRSDPTQLRQQFTSQSQEQYVTKTKICWPIKHSVVVWRVSFAAVSTIFQETFVYFCFICWQRFGRKRKKRRRDCATMKGESCVVVDFRGRAIILHKREKGILRIAKNRKNGCDWQRSHTAYYVISMRWLSSHTENESKLKN